MAASEDLRERSPITREEVLVSRLRLPTAISDHCCLPPFMYKMVMNSPSELVFFSFHEKTLKPFIGSSSFPAP